MKFTGAQPMEPFRKVAERAQGMLEADPQSFIGKRRVLLPGRGEAQRQENLLMARLEGCSD